jgi:carbon-monoxide dehydrogenase small subunit
MIIELKVNNVPKKFEIYPDEMLGDVLRRYGYTSVKKSCGTGNCGICTVLVNDKPVPSCSYFAAKVEGCSVTTMEGVQKEAREIAEFISKEGAEQCGFCSTGFVMTIIAMKKELVSPTEEDIKNYLVGNLCRCSGYMGHLRAIKKYLEVQ